MFKEKHFAWRLPVEVLPLEDFDRPGMHDLSEFHPDKISIISTSRMAGSAVQRSPAQIRQMILAGRFDVDERAYLRGLLMQFDCEDMRRFLMYCGVSRYQIARAMIACDVRHHLLGDWINGHVPGYLPQREHYRTWNLSSRI